MNIRVALLASAAIGVFLSFGSAARAITVELDFSANFPAGSPDATLTGQFVYQAASVTSPVDSLTWVDLTIAGHTYTLAELGSKTLDQYNLIGSTSAGLGRVTAGDDSFYVQYDRNTGTPVAFLYSASSFPSIVDAVTYPQFNLSVIPGTLYPRRPPGRFC
jgi:hypothetical protein